MLRILTENPAYYKILDAEFPNRHGDYLESLLKKAGVSQYVVQCGEFNLQSCDSSVIVTLGKTPTREVLELKKSFNFKDYAGQICLKGTRRVLPWYSLEHLLIKGKKLELETIQLLRNLK